jgi:hypothetical protein
VISRHPSGWATERETMLPSRRRLWV